MLNGWFTCMADAEPGHRKRSHRVSQDPGDGGPHVRDQIRWDLASGRNVANVKRTIGSQTAASSVPRNDVRSRDENFRRGREPEEADLPTPESNRSRLMSVPDGFRVGNVRVRTWSSPNWPNQPIRVSYAKGRLWVSCMPKFIRSGNAGAKRLTTPVVDFRDTDGERAVRINQRRSMTN